MRARHALLWGLVVLLPAIGEAQPFDPNGRRPRPPGGGTARPPGPSTGRPSTPKKGPSVDTLIARYTAILLQQPEAPFPLQKLTELYRQRDGKLDALVSDFEQRAGQPGPDQLNARLVLGAVYSHARRLDEARDLLSTIATDQPKLATPRLMLAALAESRGDRAEARSQYEAALPLLPPGVQHERVNRSLMLLCLELKDFDAAKRYHQTLVRAAGGSLFVRKELGRELLDRGEYERAEAEFRDLVKASAGDNRALAPALRDLGHALAKRRKLDEALEVLSRARRVGGQDSGIRNEILALLTDIYREQGKLAELLTILESEPGRDAKRLATIAALHEETGQVDKAIAAYRAAIRADGTDVDSRVHLVHLLQSAGLLDEAVREYEALVRAAPGNPDFVFELADTLIQRGARADALRHLTELERRSRGEADLLATLADYYERIEEPARARVVLERLAGAALSDPQHLVDLGDRYFQSGEVARAKETWNRIRSVVRSRAEADAILGEVYLDHDMTTEALAALREAVTLDAGSVRYRKALAMALERAATGGGAAAGSYGEALGLWQELLGGAPDAALEREARNHVVSLWSILRRLPNQVAPLTRKLEATPPDLVSGRLLAEVQRRLGRLDHAEQTLRVVTGHAPGDEASWLALERILVLRHDLDGAIAVLERLVEVNPRQAREYYERMATYAAEQYRDDDAIRYAARAVELAPDDAAGHYRLGRMYRRRQDIDLAVLEFRRAITKNDRLFAAHFDLAELLLSQDQLENADRLYRHVIRACRDEQLVGRAARLSMQLNLGRGTLESLERELLPVTLGNPQKPIYRRLLVELYGAMTFPLVHAARLGDPAARAGAREQLTKIGSRAVKPLLDALADSDLTQQRIAIEVLAYVENRSAGPALFNYATGQADRQLRVRAMVACGALADEALLPRYESALGGRDLDAETASGTELAAGDAVSVAAAWGVARLGSRKAEPLLQRLLESSSPDVRALALLGLGLTGNPKHVAIVARLARSADAGPLARAAAAHALGELGARTERPMLLALAESADATVRHAALLAVARLDAKQTAGTIEEDVGSILVRASVSEDPELRATAIGAATAIATGEYRRPGPPLPVPNAAVDVATALTSLGPTGYTSEEGARGVLGLGPMLRQGATGLVASSPEQAQVLAGLLLAGFRPLLGAETSAAGPPAPSDATAKALAKLADQVADAAVAGFAALAQHPSGEVRKQAIEFLARRSDPVARGAVADALLDPDPEVVKTALGVLRDRADASTVDAMIELLRRSPSWALRSRAAGALGGLPLAAKPLPSTHAGSASKPSTEGPARPAGTVDNPIDEALTTAARADGYALVREAALEALHRRSAPRARAALDHAMAHDEEPRIRELARSLLQSP